MSKTDVHIEYCNNIDSCDISIEHNCLNIKYAINGTGKSTIAKAINLASKNESLSALRPFSHLARKEKTLKPFVSDMPFSNVHVFNEEYLSKFVYQKTELMPNSFEIFIQDDKYKKLKNNIDIKVESIKLLINENQNVYELKSKLDNICKLMAINNDGSLSRKIIGQKNVLDNDKCAIFNPPDVLKSSFAKFFGDINAGEWATWKLNGINNYDTKGICPYCADVETEKQLEQTKVFKEVFDEPTITYTDKLREYLTSIEKYIDKSKMNDLLGLLHPTADKIDRETSLTKFRAEVLNIYTKLDDLSKFSGFSIEQNEINEVADKLLKMKITEKALDYFNTEAFLKEVHAINIQLEKILSMIEKLKSAISNFHKYLKEKLDYKIDDINHFFKTAGYNYNFDIISNGEEDTHAVIYHIENNKYHAVDKPNMHLSWGEKNAFALILFMFDAISRKADLIILDDPISSFDSNKKYAIINRLFKTGDKDNSLYQRTVLLLTHDFEPVIDHIQLNSKLDKKSIYAHYLQNKKGVLSEKSITNDEDMMSLVVLMKKLARNEELSLPVRIGCLRKYIEHTTATLKNNMAYHILSGLIHHRPYPTYDKEGENKLSESDFESGNIEIQKMISGFDYFSALSIFEYENLLDIYEDEENSFFRLLILRAYTESNTDARNRLIKHDDILRKYIDETYHIENDYLYSLDVTKYDIVPQYCRNSADNFVRQELYEIGILVYEDLESKHKIDLYDLPVSAGSGVYSLGDLSCEEHYTDNVECDYAVRVHGYSMIPTLDDGDILLIKTCEDPPIDKIGVYFYDGNVWCKRLKKVEKKPHLFSDNPDFGPIPIKDWNRLDFQGVLVEIIKST